MSVRVLTTVPVVFTIPGDGSWQDAPSVCVYDMMPRDCANETMDRCIA
jgi:hypothetical protein